MKQETEIDTVQDLELFLEGQGDLTFPELEPHIRNGSVLMRLIGEIVRYVKESEQVGFNSIDLISEEGWKKAIQQQGVAAGREQVKVVILELLMEGLNSVRTESGDDGGDATG